MQESPAACFITNLPVGFASAVLPVAAQTITTDTSRLAGEVSIPTVDGQIPVSRNAEIRKSFPVVLVLQEISGVHEHIYALVHRSAQKISILGTFGTMYL